jgi:hypothetical protein
MDEVDKTKAELDKAFQRVLERLRISKGSIDRVALAGRVGMVFGSALAHMALSMKEGKPQEALNVGKSVEWEMSILATHMVTFDGPDYNAERCVKLAFQGGVDELVKDLDLGTRDLKIKA